IAMRSPRTSARDLAKPRASHRVAGSASPHTPTRLALDAPHRARPLLARPSDLADPPPPTTAGVLVHTRRRLCFPRKLLGILFPPARRNGMERFRTAPRPNGLQGGVVLLFPS